MNKYFLVKRRKDYGFNKILFFSNYILYKFNKTIDIRLDLFAYYFFQKNNIKVPKIIKYNLEETFFIQERIMIDKNKIVKIKKILNDFIPFYENTLVEIKKKGSINSIRKIKYNIKNEKNLGEFIIGFLENIKKTFFLNKDNTIRVDKIINKVKANKTIFLDKHVYFIHGDLDSPNILINKYGEYYYIDYETSGYFDYYYDFVCLSIINEKEFFSVIKSFKINFSIKRFEINKLIYYFLYDIYN